MMTPRRRKGIRKKITRKKSIKKSIKKTDNKTLNKIPFRNKFKKPTKIQINNFAKRLQRVYRKYKIKVLIRDIVLQIEDLQDDFYIHIDENKNIGFSIKKHIDNPQHLCCIFIVPKFIDNYLRYPNRFRQHFFADLINIVIYNPQCVHYGSQSTICPGAATQYLKNAVYNTDIQTLIIVLFSLNTVNYCRQHIANFEY